jgi:tetratricopeptide (TPR) repeat protein
MKNFNWILPTLIVQCAFFFSSTLIANAADETPTPTATPKPIDPGKVDRAMEFFNKGNEYGEKGLKERAREYWKIASELDPRLSEDGNGSASLFFGLDQVSETTFRTTDPAKQKKILEFLSKARLADKENDYDSAMKYLDSANDFSANEPQVRALRIEITLDDFKENDEVHANPIAKNYFDEAVEYYRHGKFSEALDSLNQAEELEPRNLQILNLKSIIQEDDSSILLSKDVQRAKEQWQEGNSEISTEILDGILKKNPQYQPALDLRAEIETTKEKESSSEVQAALDQAAKEEKNDHFSEAKKDYEKVLGFDPNNRAASAGLGRVGGLVDPLPEKIKGLEKALAAGQKRKAAVFLKEVEALSPDNPKLDYWKEKISELSGNSVPESDESKADEAYNLGLESYRNGNLDDAKKFWSQTLDLNPQHLQAKRDLDRLLEEHPELK